MAVDPKEALKHFLEYIFTEPEGEEVVNMDCNDCCEHTSWLAEQVESGANLVELLPEMERHMHCYPCVREEFEGLVDVLRAQNTGEIEAESDQAESDQAESDQDQ